MKILLIAPVSPPTGGMAIWTENYIDEIKKVDGFEVDLINTAEINKFNLKIVNELIRNIRIIWNALHIKKEDIVHICTPCHYIGIFRDMIICKVLNMKKIPYLFHIHSNLKEFVSDHKLSKKALDYCLKHSKKIIVLNKNAFDYVDNENKVIINNFIDMKKMHQYIKESQEEEIKKICFVGHFKKEKGSEDYEEIASKFPEIDFFVYGRVFDKPNRDLPNLKFCGNLDRNQLFSELSKMDLLLFVSHHEGSPLTIVEAASIKLPIISTDVGDVKDKLANDCIVKIGDTSGIIGKIEKYKNTDKRMEIAEENYKKCFNYDSEIIISKYIDCYKG